MMETTNLRNSEPEQLELFVEEEEPHPTWGEIIRDPKAAFTLGCLVIVVLLMIFW